MSARVIVMADWREARQRPPDGTRKRFEPRLGDSKADHQGSAGSTKQKHTASQDPAATKEELARQWAAMKVRYREAMKRWPRS